MDAFPDAGNNEGCLDLKTSNSKAGWWVDQERERRDTTSRTGRCLAINFVAKLLTEERSAKSISAHSTSWLRCKERSTQFSVHRMLSKCLEDEVGVGASAGNRQRVRAHAPPCNDLDTLDDILPRDCLSARNMRARSGSGGCSLFPSPNLWRLVKSFCKVRNLKHHTGENRTRRGTLRDGSYLTPRITLYPLEMSSSAISLPRAPPPPVTTA